MPSNQTAYEAYREKVGLLRAQAKLLADVVEDLDRVPEASVNWANVGDVAHLDLLLGQALAFIYSGAGGKQNG